MLPKVFVASSNGKGRIIAEAFIRYTDENKKICKFYPWWDRNTLKLGSSVAEAIVNLCRDTIDYSLIFYTDNDAETKSTPWEGRSKEDIRISQNCLIEWGISVGALGLKRTICFTSIDPDYFPFDIRDINKRHFFIPSKLKNSTTTNETREEEIKDLMNNNKELLNNFIDDLGSVFDKKNTFYLKKPILEIAPQDMLFEFEQILKEESNGRLKKDSTVEVALRSPVEANDAEMVKKIIKNCENDINYHYIYSYTKENVLNRDTQTTITSTIRNFLETRKKDFREDLNRATKNELYIDFINMLKRRITFYFDFNSGGFEYCIHDYVDEGKVVYLKFCKNKKAYYAKLYDDDNKNELLLIRTNLDNFNTGFKENEHTFFGELDKDKVSEETFSLYNNFIKNLINMISKRLTSDTYDKEVIDCVTQYPELP